MTQSINNVIKNTESHSKSMVAIATSSNDNINQIDSEISGIASSTNTITSNLEKLSASTQEVTSSADIVSEISIDNLKSAEIVKDAIDEIENQTNGLKKFF